MASPRPRPRTADPESHYSFLGTRRSFPLVGRRKTKSGISLTPERPSTSHHPLPLAAPTGLRVRLFLRFSSPLNSDHYAEFLTSPSFEPSDQVCQALLRRLQHCSAELITRRDRTALDPPQAPSQSRPMRFQITYCIDRQGLRWAEETFTSYQQDPVDPDLEQEIIEESRLSISSFLSRHDPGFTNAEAGSAAVRPETSRPLVGLPQPACCIPQETHSSPTPGYLIELFLRSRCQSASQATSFRIESHQSTPLTLLLGEDVLSKTTKLLDAAFEERKIRFDEVHRWCDGLQGDGGCTHVIDGAFDALVKIRNNIGPDYNHLSHRLQTYRILFDQDEAHEFEQFTNSLKEQLEGVRELADRGLNAVDDMTLSIRKLERQGQLTLKPLCVSLDASATYNRTTTKALMSRIQSGIRDVLNGTGASLSLTAHKRGHLVLDTTIRDSTEGASGNTEKPSVTTDELLTELKNQLQADLTMVCKDTCSLDTSDCLMNMKIFDARTAASDDNRPSTSGPMMPDEAPVTPTRHSLLKRKAQTNLRQVSLSEPAVPAATNEFIQAHGYMAGLISDDAYMSDDSSTPSLVDTDSVSPHDSILITPESSRVGQRGPPNFGIRLMDDELAGTPISTQDILPTQDEVHEQFEVPPFQSAFGALKPSPTLPGSLSQDDIRTIVPSKSQDSPLETNVMTRSPDISVETESKEVSPGSVEERGPCQSSVPEAEASTLGPRIVFPSVERLETDDALTRLPEPSKSKSVLADEATVAAAPMPSSEICLATSTDEQQVGPFQGEEDARVVSNPFIAPAVADIPPSIRPPLTTTIERPKSSALIVRTSAGSFAGNSVSRHARTNSGFDNKLDRRWSSPRPAFHRRQFSSPTAGYLGLHGEYLVRVGLMNAVIPSHLRSNQT